MSSGFDDLQPTDDTSTEEAAANTVRSRVERVRQDEHLTHDARIRELLKHSEKALTGTLSKELQRIDNNTDDDNSDGDEDGVPWGDANPDAVLTEISDLLAAHDRMPTALIKDVEPDVAIRWKAMRRARERGQGVADLVQEHSVYAALAQQIGIIGGYSDRSQYAPVRLEALDQPGAKSLVEDGEQTPVGRLRVAAGDGVDLTNRVTTIPLKDAKHLLAIADPRSGKDSTIVRLAGNLKDEHGYKWISIYDDGRDENQMVAVPSDDPHIRRNLESFGQSPKGYPTTVYVPAVDLPDELPNNHEPFSVGVDSLTADMLTRLAGLKPSENVESRVSKALKEAQDGDGDVWVVIDKLKKYSEETEAEITVQRPDDDADGRYETIEMGASDVLNDIVESLALAVGKGLIRSRGAASNIDMQDVLADQERVAALNSNHVDDSLKHLTVLIWLELIWEARGEDKDLPRVALETREIKNLAPSKIGDVKYTSIARGLKQMFYLLASQGSARRIMMLASTQKIKDLYKSIRSNMAHMILMKLKREKISEIGGFTHRERRSLMSMEQGWGMLVGGGGSVDKHYPIQWCGARCGLGYGDLNWRRRYGEASGWRVADGSEDLDDEVVYIDGFGERVTAGDEPLESGDWWLLPRDVDGHDTIEAALRERAVDGLPEVFFLTDPSEGIEEVDMDMMGEAEAMDAAEQRAREELPAALQDWMDRDAELRERWLLVLQIIRETDDVTSYDGLAGLSPLSKGTISNYMTGELDACTTKSDGEYELSRLGELALEHEDTLTQA